MPRYTNVSPKWHKKKSKKKSVEEGYNPDFDIEYDQFASLSRNLLEKNHVIRLKSSKTNVQVLPTNILL